MLQINKQVELRTNCDEKQLVLNCLYLVEHHFTFELSVISGLFRGTTPFCISYKQIKETIKSLDKLHKELSGVVTILDCDSDSFIDFKIIDKVGHLEVRGQVGSSIEEHLMRFRFITDQTVIPSFIEQLNEVLWYYMV